MAQEMSDVTEAIRELTRTIAAGNGNRRLSRDEWAAVMVGMAAEGFSLDGILNKCFTFADAMLAASKPDNSESVDVGKVMEEDYESSDVYWPNEAYADAIEIGRGYRKQRDEARAELEKLRQENVGKVMERHVKGGWNPHAEQQTQEPPDPPPPPPPSQTLPSDGWKKLAEHNYKAAERHRDERDQARAELEAVRKERDKAQAEMRNWSSFTQPDRLLLKNTTAELAAVRKERDELLRQIKSWKAQRAEWITERERWIAEGNAFRKERDEADRKLCELVRAVLGFSRHLLDGPGETATVPRAWLRQLVDAIKAAKGEA